MDVKKEIMAYVLVAFALLGVLFGMNIMAFIFGNLGPANAGLPDGDAAFNASLEIQNASLASISTYANASSSQFTVLSISIILILLIGLFAVFWTIFMTGKKGEGRGLIGGGNFS